MTHLQAIYAEHRLLFEKKLSDYGTDDITEVGIGGVVSRLTDKLARIKNLLKTGAKPNFESTEDTLMDIIGYSIIALLLQRGQWSKSDYNAETAIFSKTYAPSKETPKETVGDMAEQEMKSSAAQPVGQTVLVLREEAAKGFPIPKQAKEGDSGLDMYVLEDTVVPANSKFPVDVPSGLRCSLPKGYWAMIINRSSANKRGLIVASNVIDQGYQGSLYATCRNTTDEDLLLKRGERVAQFVLIPLVPVDCKEVMTDAEFPVSERGTSGWGSTGK